VASSATEASFTWTEPTYDGGSDVIDYSISYAIVSSSRRLQEITYTLLASGITTTYYTATGLIPGTKYLFFV
jgi:hypothetical protein